MLAEVDHEAKHQEQPIIRIGVPLPLAHIVLDNAEAGARRPSNVPQPAGLVPHGRGRGVIVRAVHRQLQQRRLEGLRQPGAPLERRVEGSGDDVRVVRRPPVGLARRHGPDGELLQHRRDKRAIRLLDVTAFFEVIRLGNQLQDREEIAGQSLERLHAGGPVGRPEGNAHEVEREGAWR